LRPDVNRARYCREDYYLIFICYGSEHTGDNGPDVSYKFFIYKHGAQGTSDNLSS